MENTKPTIEQTMEKLAETIRTVPEEKQEEVQLFLEGYMAAMERMMGRAAS